jgi:hypothetical protein
VKPNVKHHTDLIVLACALATGACGEGAAPAFTVRDSAGVRIAASTVPAWGEESPWRVSSEPSLVIGAEGEGPYELFRVFQAVRLDDGTIVVADNGSAELRWFDAEGRHLRTVGGRGRGPGEFQGFNGLMLLGDTLLVWDARQTRQTRLGLDGRLIGSTQFEESGGPMPLAAYQMEGLLGDGSLVMTRYAAPLRRGPPGPVWDSAANLLYGLDGVFRDSVGYTGMELYLDPSGPSTSGFPHLTRSAVGSRRFFTGAGRTWQIQEYGADGRIVGLIRLDRDRPPVTEADQGAWIEWYVGLVDAEQRSELRRQLEERPAPETKPAYGIMKVDALGYLWVQEYRSYADRGPSQWTVIEPDGRWLGSLTLPDMSVKQIGADWILGVATDELDVERVVVYGLERGGS